MRKVVLGEPVVVAQSTTEPILFGGYQDPTIRCSEDGVLYVRFNTRRDCYETFGQESKNPIYKSVDKGVTWEKTTDITEWVRARPALPNGDYLQFCEHEIVKDLPKLPKIPEYRARSKYMTSTRWAYKVDELLPILGDRVAKEFKFMRIKKGENTITHGVSKINWPDMPISFYDGFLVRCLSERYKVDKNNVMWMPVQAPYILPDGRLGSKYCCTHLLRSDDFGYNWDYVSTVVYKDEYNPPTAIDVEGFNEAALEILDDGSIIMIMRSGSLHPFMIGDDEHPAPKIYFVKSTDGGKTWSEPSVFYDYGVRPNSVKMGCGTIIMTSGRPGVYIRTCDDPKGEKWNDVIHVLSVPKEDKYKAYFEYSCANNDICAYDDHTAFLTYSNFQLKTPEGKRAKSIIVQKITLE